MKGNNTLHVNQSTMIEIVQQWVRREFASKNLVVKEVQSEPASRLHFSVVLDAPEQKETR